MTKYAKQANKGQKMVRFELEILFGFILARTNFLANISPS
jgi:hypothetical protein